MVGVVGGGVEVAVSGTVAVSIAVVATGADGCVAGGTFGWRAVVAAVVERVPVRDGEVAALVVAA